ncbi:MAG: hypothetical protein A2504_11305 [Bdellovibrionales bacterium RIFOXYD12_FULL_39_22]|nr:MAG: hypothetical protein A2385_09870 [Bdellovibrionales bacterium RIFOXYB1_FULL_39_21]OFZ44258.1 MAG: hypothetical protein A2485_07490 [Bdellovibrionales bacterium RIFOXYC12_FULL_39_17]OFZ46800.1 MAG: hypothetical protein A2404_04725 [Bdellovibrionales bacterium RIFOXYC1_FULL_39_130]OFZ73967.1 MAG: hypothetical protein A2451_00570 [Bdellovibrionales bacterium RIFOXYC2_FULL_39_8]OFZ75923.1 MAG: hypothetical protein A2560_02425 [Bdellovibrionales bacterium RIFOXYD1_FULL_39_84]OFZ95479.1 MAG:
MKFLGKNLHRLSFFLAITLSLATTSSFATYKFGGVAILDSAMKLTYEANKEFANSLMLKVLAIEGNNIFFVGGALDKIYPTMVGPNESDIILNPPFAGYSYTKVFSAAGYSVDELSAKALWTTPDLYKKETLYGAMGVAGVQSYSFSKELALTHALSVGKNFHKYYNGPLGQYTSVVMKNALGIRYSVGEFFSCGLNFVFSNLMNYAGRWSGSHATEAALEYAITESSFMALGISSGGPNLKYEQANYSLYHTDATQVGVSLGVKF